MNNSEKYHFSDFTSSNYRQLIRLANERFVFQTFSNFSKDTNFILWRHDVDFSMHRALKLARIEAEENIRATYYILLHSEFYNLLEKEISDILREIISLGHEIGLHFDSHYYDIMSEDELEKKMIFEKKILETLFNVPVKSFCFHIHNAFTLSCCKNEYAGMVNAFSEYFQKNIPYCSDSNGYWRFRRLEEVLQDPAVKQLQVLTHPELWQDEIMSPKQRVYRCAEQRALKTKSWYDKVLSSNGRENIDW